MSFIGFIIYLAVCFESPQGHGEPWNGYYVDEFIYKMTAKSYKTIISETAKQDIHDKEIRFPLRGFTEAMLIRDLDSDSERKKLLAIQFMSKVAHFGYLAKHGYQTDITDPYFRELRVSVFVSEHVIFSPKEALYQISKDATPFLLDSLQAERQWLDSLPDGDPRHRSYVINNIFSALLRIYKDDPQIVYDLCREFTELEAMNENDIWYMYFCIAIVEPTNWKEFFKELLIVETREKAKDFLLHYDKDERIKYYRKLQ